ncbi:class I SAM-dependent methyltransferase [Microbulbifer sp. SSSA002]|uniref:class I SAM-dependent methyltransferase n=1 Tax=Microbulbifer sp. SSSA002 TaxID=3243376 RepID=UPI00403913F2
MPHLSIPVTHASPTHTRLNFEIQRRACKIVQANKFYLGKTNNFRDIINPLSFESPQKIASATKVVSMQDQDPQFIASQLSCPKGEAGVDMGNKMNILNQIITQQTIEKLSPQQAESIVEIGPGNGLLSLPILDALGADGHYLGIEMSETMAGELQSAIINKSCTTEVICGDCLEVQLKAESVDGIIGVNILYFIQDLLAFFTHIIHWIKPGGRVVFSIRSDKSLKKLPFTQFDFHIRNTSEIESLMQNAGFDAIESYSFDEQMIPFGDTLVPADSVIIAGEKPHP